MVKLTRTGLAGQEIMTLIRRVSKTKHRTKKAKGPKGTSFFFFFFGLPVWNGDKCTRQSLKNWIQVTDQSLLSSETQGRPGTFSESRHCL